ncbi:CitB: CitB domain protein (plasmid) [Antarctobacter heliothermus]|uniref:CitB: CitB domain protein n=1 Tax=Antarctobacter heliothermus TaxID=74033 RepID=A0A222EBM8_9RHOB|nr:hypothetical protein [Antarctobacter heliothermus]ASP23478.1 CitB: CitB domain protein [Antarctobacter heliothermus]
MLVGPHLGVVLALFITIPYGKFVHGIYRFVVLGRHVEERKKGPKVHRQPFYQSVIAFIGQ